MPNTDVEQLSIDTIRTLSMDAVQQANAGHPGTAMALAPLAYLLFTRYLRHSPSHPEWPDRDRFVLSAGHAAILQYAALHLTGYNLSLEELKRLVEAETARAGLRERWQQTEDAAEQRQILEQSLVHIGNQLDLVRARREELHRLERELRARQRRVRSLLRAKRGHN